MSSVTSNPLTDPSKVLGTTLYVDGKPIGKVTSIERRLAPQNPFSLGELTVEIKTVAGAFRRSAELTGKLLMDGTFDDLAKIFTQNAEALCPERCECLLYQCQGEDPHEKAFGPFHVYPQHPCKDLADPLSALLDAPEPEGRYRTILDEPEPTSAEEFYHSLGISAERRRVPDNVSKGSIPTDDRGTAIPIPTSIQGQWLDSPREPLPSDRDADQKGDDDYRG